MAACIGLDTASLTALRTVTVTVTMMAMSVTTQVMPENMVMNTDANTVMLNALKPNAISRVSGMN